MQSIILIEKATKTFKDKSVFKDVNISIQKGSCIGFSGHNGCGKSVLLKCICGFSLLNQGRIVCNDKIINKDIDFIQDTGIIIETPEFINDLTGYKNLKIIAEIRNVIDDKDILKTMEILDLEKDKDKKVGKYSLGMKQKLRIAQAIMEKPKILILDEPTNGLDKKSVVVVREILKKFIKKGGTLVMTSHNKEDMNILCDQVYEYDNYNFHMKSNE